MTANISYPYVDLKWVPSVANGFSVTSYMIVETQGQLPNLHATITSCPTLIGYYCSRLQMQSTTATYIFKVQALNALGYGAFSSSSLTSSYLSGKKRV